METSGSINCCGVQSRGDLGGAIRTREIIAWERSTQNSRFDFLKQVIYCQRHGYFTSTRQNEIKVGIKNLNKLCERPQPVLGSNAESHVPCGGNPFFIALLCPAPPGSCSSGCHFGWREAVEVAAQALSVHCASLCRQCFGKPAKSN